jgi:hypothetical protein
MKFYLCFAGLCLVFPPLVGLAIGVGIFVAIKYLFFRILEG